MAFSIGWVTRTSTCSGKGLAPRFELKAEEAQIREKRRKGRGTMKRFRTPRVHRPARAQYHGNGLRNGQCHSALETSSFNFHPSHLRSGHAEAFLRKGEPARPVSQLCPPVPIPARKKILVRPGLLWARPAG